MLHSLRTSSLLLHNDLHWFGATPVTTLVMILHPWCIPFTLCQTYLAGISRTARLPISPYTERLMRGSKALIRRQTSPAFVLVLRSCRPMTICSSRMHQEICWCRSRRSSSSWLLLLLLHSLHGKRQHVISFRPRSRMDVFISVRLDSCHPSGAGQLVQNVLSWPASA